MVFEGSGKIKKTKRAVPRWPPFGNHGVIPGIIRSCCVSQRKHIIHTKYTL